MEDIGTLTAEVHPDRGSVKLRIVESAPRVRITRRAINRVERGDSDFPASYFALDGDVLTIRDDYGQRFIYRIHWDDYADGGYLAEWPD